MIKLETEQSNFWPNLTLNLFSAFDHTFSAVTVISPATVRFINVTICPKFFTTNLFMVNLESEQTLFWLNLTFGLNICI